MIDDDLAIRQVDVYARSRSVTVSLWVPVNEAMRMGADDLVAAFSEQAEAAGGELVDDSESVGNWEWYEFSGLIADQVRIMAARVITNHASISVTDSAPDDGTTSQVFMSS